MLSIQNNQMMVEQFVKVQMISHTQITIQMKESLLYIRGNSLKVLALSKEEIRIEGRLQALEFAYDKE